MLILGVLGQQVKDQANALRGDIENKLNDQLAGKLGELENSLGELDKLDELLKDNKGSLENLKF